jgi:hypothetical protein
MEPKHPIQKKSKVQKEIEIIRRELSRITGSIILISQAIQEIELPIPKDIKTEARKELILSSAPQTTVEVLSLWMNKLPEGARRILSVLIDANGEYIPEEELLEQAKLRKTGTFSNYKSMLVTARLMRVNGNTYAADKETLFL